MITKDFQITRARLFSVTLLLALLVGGAFGQVGQSAGPGSFPTDLPIPTITVSTNPSDGYIFAAVPYWGAGNSYLVMYSNDGKPVFHRRVSSTCTDFKVQENGAITYFDYGAKKFFMMDSTFAVVDSFWVQNGFATDEHDIKMLPNGNVLLIGYDHQLYDMSQIVPGGDRNASVVVNVVQELDAAKNVVFEWKAYEHYKLTDVGPAVNLLDVSFIHSHVNSVDVDRDGNLILSSRNLEEITKVDRRTGDIIWRLGGKNNQFQFLVDSIGFSAQHSVHVLPNGNLLLFDNGNFHMPHFSRAAEYRLDEVKKTATLVWSYRNSPDVASIFWGNAQRLRSGNTFISWGKSEVAATEVDSSGMKVFEMTFPKDVFSYRIFRFPLNLSNVVTEAMHSDAAVGFDLAQNFPNPFNGSTLISYQVPEPGPVSLRVFDLLGRESATLVESKQGAGSYRAVFSPRDLPSGVYFYRLQTGNGVKTGRMLYLK